jgi:phage terminase small subunit
MAGIVPAVALDEGRAPGAVAAVARPPLTDRQHRYIEARAEGHPRHKAGILAGLSPGQARTLTEKWDEDPRIIAAIADAQEFAGTKVGVSPVDVIRELMVIAFATHDDYVIDGGDVRLAEDAPRSAMRAIKTRKKKVTYTEGGDEVVTVEIVLHDKIAALKMLGDHLSMWMKRLQINQDDDVKAALSSMRKAVEQVTARTQSYREEERRQAEFEMQRIAEASVAVAASPQPLSALRALAERVHEAEG